MFAPVYTRSVSMHLGQNIGRIIKVFGPHRSMIQNNPYQTCVGLHSNWCSGNSFKASYRIFQLIENESAISKLKVIVN